MSQKRKRTDFADVDHDSQRPSKKKPFVKNKQQKFKAKRLHTAQDEPQTTSTGELRSRIRNLRRLLEHVDSMPKNKMPANIRIERERELETCQHELAAKQAAAEEAERRSKMIGKYHHVRFFDRQKATRILKKLKRQYSAQEDRDKPEDSDLLQQIHDAEVAVNYAIYYPLMKPYSALYPRENQNKAEQVKPLNERDNRVHKGDPEIWKAVEEAMEQGTLDELRNRETNISSARPNENKKKNKVQVKLTKPAVQEEDDDSDGGFFE